MPGPNAIIYDPKIKALTDLLKGRAWFPYGCTHNTDYKLQGSFINQMRRVLEHFSWSQTLHQLPTKVQKFSG